MPHLFGAQTDGTLNGSSFSFARSAVLPSAAHEWLVVGLSAPGGSYSVAFTASHTDAPSAAAAVPEPASWVLLMPGGMGPSGARELKGAAQQSSQALAA